MNDRIEKYDVIVIGGGPAGMMAAGRAAERGRKVLLAEKNDILGRKLLISGKGRCNITNAGDINDHLESFGKSGRFLRNAFSRIFTGELIDFFESRGVKLKTERGKRVFPVSDRSKDILDAIRKYLDEKGVKVIMSSEAKNITVDKNGAKKVVAIRDDVYLAESVAVCTGGVSYPGTGSTGFGSEIAKRLGHNVIKPRPALVPLVTKSNLPKTWQGVSLENVEASVMSKGKKRAKKFGDLIFTHFGMSGPIILDLSADVYDFLALGDEVFISINLKPGLDPGKLDARLVRELSEGSNKTIKNILKEMLPSKMVDGFIEYCGLPAEKKAHQVKVKERRRVAEALTDLKFEIKKTRPIEEAIVTRGGVDTKEIDPKTMESKIVKGLFFAGEAIDVDAKTGGYNMQAAFSMGYLCGDHL